jgi:sec-independent protein translocase protein TatA
MPFGIGGWEPIILLLVVILLFGPTQLPKIARNLGLGVREIKDTVEGVSKPLTDPLGVKDTIKDPLGLKEVKADPLGLKESDRERSRTESSGGS